MTNTEKAVIAIWLGGLTLANILTTIREAWIWDAIEGLQTQVEGNLELIGINLDIIVALRAALFDYLVLGR